MISLIIWLTIWSGAEAPAVIAILPTSVLCSLSSSTLLILNAFVWYFSTVLTSAFVLEEVEEPTTIMASTKFAIAFTASCLFVVA